MICMNDKFHELDEDRLKAIFKQAYYNRKISASERIQVSMTQLESLRQLKRKARRSQPEKV